MKRGTKWMAMALTSLLGAVAGAGEKVNKPVQVTSEHASGPLGSARNSPDAVQRIGCSITTYAGSAPLLTCFAHSLNTYGSCTSDDPYLVTTARAINGDSYILFRWNALGRCTSLYVENASAYAPKQL
ncbi:hypothetical protein HV824_10175 [Myxococcus sp. AM009]|uniref:hypothetical protein n=1 Tax=unclassified Myxococcus TaxID=2648731 RepID=UPI001594F064|nr:MULTISPECIES: hypothetical protein [unclassified Myxococcus]NVI98489.1 hypothetical protein [Myxococcus sp. AM009]NVJ14043.1 hypothetical protein [Myxococcus sp. AM010]